MLDATCKIAVTGKNGKCRRGYCLSTELAIDGGRSGVYCMCSKDQFLTSTGCDNKLSRRRSSSWLLHNFRHRRTCYIFQFDAPNDKYSDEQRILEEPAAQGVLKAVVVMMAILVGK